MKVWIVSVKYGAKEKKSDDIFVKTKIFGVYKTKRSADFLSKIGFKYSKKYGINFVHQEKFDIED